MLHCVLQYCQVVWMAVLCAHIALKPTLTSFIRQLNGWNRLLNPILSTIQTIHLHNLTPDITPPRSGMLSVIVILKDTFLLFHQKKAQKSIRHSVIVVSHTANQLIKHGVGLYKVFAVHIEKTFFKS